MTICVRCYVTGQVQGVFFRASTRHQAEQLGISGYARNLADGRVEVLACGSADAIDSLRAWLAKGPPSAQVSAVACEVVNETAASGFTTS